ncbi:hypothetical protein Lal_00002177 [Lupinus albus]|nr:hypothetical protein Lal_00002177 [Lupinus albus]
MSKPGRLKTKYIQIKAKNKIGKDWVVEDDSKLSMITMIALELEGLFVVPRNVMLRCEVEMTERQNRISSCKQGMPQLSWAIVF